MSAIATLLRTFFGRSGGGMLAKLVGGPMLGVILGMLKLTLQHDLPILGEPVIEDRCGRDDRLLGSLVFELNGA